MSAITFENVSRTPCAGVKGPGAAAWLASLDVPVPDYRAAIGQPVKSMRLGTPRAWFYDKLDPDHAKAVGAAVDVSTSVSAPETTSSVCSLLGA